MLAGCAASLGGLAVNLKALQECRRLDRGIAPPTINETTDYRELSSDALARIKKANNGVAARNKCEDKVVDDYARAGK